ncbi:MAG: HAD family phosphatase [Oscillospiraceae bacterium]|jgi:HAD superfamily hydrolase (TIGR01509 family)|nr:HAD family phosphatase [Oscillospiraceae bacterium]
MIKAALFDMDGTLFDTERIDHDAWVAVGLPEELYWHCIGRSRSAILDILHNGLHQDPLPFYDCYHRKTEEFLQKGIPKKPGADYILSFLQKKGCAMALVTSSRQERAERNLARAGVQQYFQAVISGDQIVHSKPAPDIFLKAAQCLNCVPKDCMVVEDSFNGVRSGRAAGMFTVMVPDLLQPSDEIRGMADAVLPSLREIAPLFEKRNAPRA